MPGSSPRQAVSTRAPARATLLVVEDEETIRMATQRALQRRGYEVLLAADGLEALEQLAAHPAIALVISDLTMPGLDGRELVRRIAADRPGLPIVLMSGYAGDLLDFATPEAGGPAFLQKPFSLDALAATVARALEAPA